MESIETYEKSYKYLNSLLRQNCNDEITINYKQLDLQSQGEIRKALDVALMKRRAEVGPMIIGVHTN